MWDWLSIFVIIAIVLVVLDGLRRKFSEKNALKIKLDNSKPGGDIANDHNSELPSGGARTVARGSNPQPVVRRRREVSARERVEPAFGDILDDDQVPHDLQRAEVEAESSHAPANDILFQNDSVGPDGLADETYDEVQDEIFDESPDEALEQTLYADLQKTDEPEADNKTLAAAPAADLYNDVDDEIDAQASPLIGEESFTNETIDTEDKTVDDYDDVLISPAAEEEKALVADRGDAPKKKSRSRQKKASRSLSRRFFRPNSVHSELALNEDEASTPAPQSESDSDHIEDVEETEAVEEVIIINVMAPQGRPFEGAQLLQILLRQGMRLGEMSIFHRHADNNGSGPVMFSMANMVKPGTFDMANMESFTTPGVSLFTQLPSRLRHMHNFELMLETAQCLRDELHGELKDENRSVLTRQTIEHYRQRIRDFELQRLTRK